MSGELLPFLNIHNDGASQRLMILARMDCMENLEKTGRFESCFYCCVVIKHHMYIYESNFPGEFLSTGWHIWWVQDVVVAVLAGITAFDRRGDNTIQCCSSPICLHSLATTADFFVHTNTYKWETDLMDKKLDCAAVEIIMDIFMDIIIRLNYECLSTWFFFRNI